jgi:hypothetical protein
MATSKPQDSTAIPMHKRIAMGEKLDGTSLQSKANPQKSAKGVIPTKQK